MLYLCIFTVYYIYCILRDNFMFKVVPILSPDGISPPPLLFLRLLTYADVCYILYSQRQLRVQSGADAQP